MARFLHIADVHLGFDRYDSPERTRDFFYAFNDLVERYAIEDAVDFVIIVGDLFEHRTIQPAVLNHAQIVLRSLQAANIPVIAIEGNHDNRPYGVATSWLRYLSDWGLLTLLEPGAQDAGEPFYEPWDGRRGGYIDLDCGVRIIGSQWYGASAPMAIQQIATAIKQLPPGPAHQILLFHHGLEGQIARYQGALRYGDLLPLKTAGVDYLALGHIHKSYIVEDWVFNPGSVEANSVEEVRYERGGFQVTIDPSGIQAKLCQDYQQRPIVRLSIKTQGQELMEELVQLALKETQAAIASGAICPDEHPIVELQIRGTVGFNRLDLDLRDLQQQLQNLTHALIFLLKFNVDTLAYGSPSSPDSDRHQIERDIYLDLLSANSAYRSQASALAEVLLELKHLQLEGRSEDELYTLLASFCSDDT
ncbi:MAG TPA: DNA repair exonuclease [Candidatus Obscuribacterales bacterium]